MDLRSLKLHLADRHVRMVTAAADGEAKRDLEGEKFERVADAAAPLLAAIEARVGGACHVGVRAVSIDPQFHQARFNLARAYARDGQRAAAAREAQELLSRLPADAPQRAEVQRLLDAVR